MSRNSTLTIRLLGSASALVLLPAPAAPAHAADAAAAASDAGASGMGPTEVEAIVVTASKRSETVQNSVGTITGLSEAVLKARGIQTLDDVSQHAPGMT